MYDYQHLKYELRKRIWSITKNLLKIDFPLICRLTSSYIQGVYFFVKNIKLINIAFNLIWK